MYIYKRRVEAPLTGDFAQILGDKTQGFDFRNFQANITIQFKAEVAVVNNTLQVLYKIIPEQLVDSLCNVQTNMQMSTSGFILYDSNSSYGTSKQIISENTVDSIQAMFQEYKVPAKKATTATAEQLQQILGYATQNNKSKRVFDPNNVFHNPAADAAVTIDNSQQKIQNVNLALLFAGLFSGGFKKFVDDNTRAYQFFPIAQQSLIRFLNNFTFDVKYPVMTNNAGTVTLKYIDATLKIDNIYYPTATLSDSCQLVFQQYAVYPKFYDQIRNESLSITSVVSNYIKLTYQCTPFVGQTYNIKKYTLHGPLQNCVSFDIYVNGLQKELGGQNFYGNSNQFAVNSDPNFKYIEYLPDNLNIGQLNVIEVYLYFPEELNNANCAIYFGAGTTKDEVVSQSKAKFKLYSTQQYVVYNDPNTFAMIAALDAPMQQKIQEKILDYNNPNMLQFKNNY